MQDMKMQDVKWRTWKCRTWGAGHENSWHETIAHLHWSYRVLVRNVVIWCITLCWFFTLLFFFFCIVCVCQVVTKITVMNTFIHQNGKVTYKKLHRLTNEELVKAVVGLLLRAFNILPVVFTTLKTNTKSSPKQFVQSKDVNITATSAGSNRSAHLVHYSQAKDVITAHVCQRLLHKKLIRRWDTRTWRFFIYHDIVHVLQNINA